MLNNIIDHLGVISQRCDNNQSSGEIGGSWRTSCREMISNYGNFEVFSKIFLCRASTLILIG